ncbi:MAG TPA: hypothetical protein VLD58_01445 [Gemmatimonadales bacterium]|nr:hypothetical protein [Gemmatimonadales bacterium]
MRISLLLLALTATTATAQSRPPVLYFQFAGEGLGFSANLDVGVTQSVRLRAGAGWLWTAATVPVSASYLLSRRNSTFEIGAGATLLIPPGRDTASNGFLERMIEESFLLRGQDKMVVPMALFGWRYHPHDGAILRVTLTPLLLRGQAHMYGGASFGFTF